MRNIAGNIQINLLEMIERADLVTDEFEITLLKFPLWVTNIGYSKTYVPRGSQLK